MPSWRCPHCSTPQKEASRCWVCHRSSTSCGTCRQFRGSVAARVGFCGLDRRREPLAGDEVRACWEDGAVAVTPDPVTPGLLDLLSAVATDDPRSPEPERPSPAWPQPDGNRVAVPAEPSTETMASAGSRRSADEGNRRDWVEV